MKPDLQNLTMEDDEILRNLRERAREGGPDAVKALLDYERNLVYQNNLRNFDDDESAEPVSEQDTVQFY